MQELFLTLPYPPSINSYWGFKGHRRFLTKKANEFKQLVAIEVTKSNVKFGETLLEAHIKWYCPDKRIRDIDNPLKPLFDSLVQANLMNDDSQIRRIEIEFSTIVRGGKAEILLFPYKNK
jgi:crossover junction endodeoxyribonuclease RusA